MKTIVSILVPVYNSESFLVDCLESISNQSYSNIQIVVVNDGSSDKSWELIKNYSSKDNRFEVYTQDNKGVAATRNRLLELANGNFVLFVDSDDWIEPNTIEILLREQKQGDFDIVTYETSYINDVWEKDTVIKQFLAHTHYNGSLWNKLIRRELFYGLEFDPDISYGEDALMVWQVLQRVDKVLLTNHHFYNHRMNDGSISHQRFGPKKMSGHKVWNTIVAQTQLLWPKYLDIARARFAAEDMWQLYFAAMNDYPKDNYIKMVQEHVREDFKLLKQSKLINKKKLLFAWCISHCYASGKLFKTLQ